MKTYAIMLMLRMTVAKSWPEERMSCRRGRQQPAAFRVWRGPERRISASESG